MSTTGYQLVTGWQIDRGRSYELDKTATGTATISTVDYSGLLDPTNASGPFYGLLQPMKQAAVALQNPVTQGWSTLFRGFVDNYDFTLDVAEKTLTAQIGAVDLQELLSNIEVVPGDYGGTDAASTNRQVPAGSEGNAYYASQRVDDRIRAALADAGIPAAWTGRIFTGNVNVQGTVYPPRQSILSVIQDAADAEFPGVANFFIDKNGKATFHGRRARFNPTDPQYGIQHWHVGDMAAVNAGGGTLAPIAGLTFDRDAKKILNAVLSTPQNIASTDIAGQLVTDATSISDYSTRSMSFENLVTLGHVDPGTTTANVETLKYATYYVDNMAQPQNRIKQVVFRPVGAADPNAGPLWNLMCGVEISDLMTITTTHPGGGGFNAVDYFVEGIHYTADNLLGSIPNVTLTVDLSPKAYYATNPFT